MTQIFVLFCLRESPCGDVSVDSHAESVEFLSFSMLDHLREGFSRVFHLSGSVYSFLITALRQPLI